MGSHYMRITKEIGSLLKKIDQSTVDSIARGLAGAGRIFLAGAGRSGYMMRSFTMRLMQCGLDAHFLGDSSTPKAQSNDILFIGSGSGETESLKAYAAAAKKFGLRVFSVTAMPDSTIGKLSDLCLNLPAPTPKIAEDPGYRSIQPMGTLFEQGLLLCLDGIVMAAMEVLNLTPDEMFERHANLE